MDYGNIYIVFLLHSRVFRDGRPPISRKPYEIIYHPFILLRFCTETDVEVSMLVRPYYSQKQRKKYPSLWFWSFHNAMISSLVYISSCFSVWGTCGITRSTLEKLRNRTVRIKTDSPYDAPYKLALVKIA